MERLRLKKLEREKKEKEREEKERIEREEKTNIINKITEIEEKINKKNKVLNYHKKRFNKYSQSSDSLSKNEEIEEQEEDLFKSKKNKTYKSKKVITNINEINTSDLPEKPIRRIYIKKKGEVKEDEDFSKYNTNNNINIYEKKIIKKKLENNYENNYDDIDKESDYYIKRKNKTLKHQNSISSDKPIYTSKRYLATKLKIFKCVIYKNLDPNVNEESIKNMLHRNGSQGFVIKLPKVI